MLTYAIHQAYPDDPFGKQQEFYGFGFHLTETAWLF